LCAVLHFGATAQKQTKNMALQKGVGVRLPPPAPTFQAS
jgi:hypothetical protein